jgi:hypothetical protein
VKWQTVRNKPVSKKKNKRKSNARPINKTPTKRRVPIPEIYKPKERPKEPFTLNDLKHITVAAVVVISILLIPIAIAVEFIFELPCTGHRCDPIDKYDMNGVRTR